MQAGDGGDLQLLARVALRDETAFEQLYRLYHPRLVRFLMNMTRRPSVVDEVLNDTMMVVWVRPEGFNGTSRLSSWIFGIAYRKALKALRDQDMPVEDSQQDLRESEAFGPEREADERRTGLLLKHALDGLSLDHRTVVELTYFQACNYKEIAEIMDCPVDTVKTRMFHARRHLARLLGGTLADWI